MAAESTHRFEPLYALNPATIESLAWKIAENRLKSELRVQTEGLGKLSMSTPDVTISAVSTLAAESAELERLASEEDFDGACR